MNSNQQFIDLKEQSKEGLKTFFWFIILLFALIGSITLIIIYSTQIDAFFERFNQLINLL